MHRIKGMTARVIRVYYLLFVLLLSASAICISGCGKQKEQTLQEIDISDGKNAEEADEKSEENSNENSKNSKNSKAQEDDKSKEDQVTEDAAQKTADNGETNRQDNIYVHVCGQVVSPGVYELPADSRIYEAIAAAGGILAEGAGDMLNQAQIVEDGMKIYVPSQEEVASGSWNDQSTGNGQSAGSISRDSGSRAGTAAASGMATGTKAEDGLVNINTATKEELMTLSGIGETRAETIIRYREEHGAFASTDDLMQIDGIKEGIYGKIKEQITV